MLSSYRTAVPDVPAQGSLPFPPGSLSPASVHKVLLVEDHDLVRLGVKALFSGADWADIEWFEAATLDDAMRCFEQHPDIAAVLLDLNLSDSKGLHGLSRLLAGHPQARVLILSGTQDEFVVRQARTMGASGYLHKGGPPATMCETLRGVLDAEGPGASAQPPAFPKAPASRYDMVADLGCRHLEIMELVLSGCTNQEISSSTKLSLGTVKNYVSTILLALDVKSRSHLISLFH